MRKLITLLVACGAFAATASPGALANNPHSSENPTGPPSQSCQEQEPNTPGKAAESPGAPFNEPGINSEQGGKGGQHYSERSQYDVACYQQAQHASR
jgi:hypothetical protein